MVKIRKVVAWAAGVACLIGLAGVVPARSAVAVFGGDLAQACFQAALSKQNHEANLQDCSKAIDAQNLFGHDLAGTYVNRGVLYMTLRQWTLAKADFEDALKIEPKMGVAWVNLGASQIGLGQDRRAIDAITTGLEVGSPEPEKGYFNRGMAHEHLGEDAAAYQDYLKAQALKPDWEGPKHELARFAVKPR